MRNIFVLIIGLGFLTGCAAHMTDTKIPSDAEVVFKYIESENLETVDRVRTFRLDGWQVIDNKYLIVTSQFRKNILVELRNNCTGLKFATTLGVDKMSSNELSAKFDSIFVPGYPNLRCRINAMYQLSKEQRKTLTENLKQKDAQ